MKPSIIKKPIAIFFLLVFVISWSLIYLIFGSEGIPATVENQQLIGMTILLGPCIAGLLLLFIYDGSQGLKLLVSGLTKLNINFRWYFVALLTAPITTYIGLLIFSFFYGNAQPNSVVTNDLLGLISLGLVGGVFVALFEEIGWTGFATPKLLEKHSIFSSGLIVGIIWGAWHFILFWEDDSFSVFTSFLLLMARLFSWLPAYRILMVWVYKNTGSLFVVIIMHVALVASLAVIDPVLQGEELLLYILIRAITLWLIVALVFLAAPKTMK